MAGEDAMQFIVGIIVFGCFVVFSISAAFIRKGETPQGRKRALIISLVSGILGLSLASLMPFI